MTGRFYLALCLYRSSGMTWRESLYFFGLVREAYSQGVSL